MLTTQALAKVKEFVESHNFDSSHGLDHVLAVLSHVQRLVLFHHEKPELTDKQIEDLNLAALLHDVDDRKFFPHNTSYQNARKILLELLPEDWFRIEKIIYLISLVSTSSNGNSMRVSEENIWMLYPRFADRLEAIGPIGIERCRQYSIHTGRPLFLSSTPRCKTEEELWLVATPDRFQRYLAVKESVSMIDHIYDKLLHIGTPEAFGLCVNEYLVREATARHDYMVVYVLNFGRTGSLDS
jgi:uncharacterized protein